MIRMEEQMSGLGELVLEVNRLRLLVAYDLASAREHIVLFKRAVHFESVLCNPPNNSSFLLFDNHENCKELYHPATDKSKVNVSVFTPLSSSL